MAVRKAAQKDRADRLCGREVYGCEQLHNCELGYRQW